MRKMIILLITLVRKSLIKNLLSGQTLTVALSLWALIEKNGHFADYFSKEKPYKNFAFGTDLDRCTFIMGAERGIFW